MNTLSDELQALLNSHSRENESNTPDFILAEYMLCTLEAYESATKKRDAWHGLPTQPGKCEKKT